ncbi:MAG: tRNA lysidine(34) synthetase TilS [bacterium]
MVLDTIRQNNLFSRGEHIIIGVSGGADSIALLHFLNSIRIDFELRITAVNINHLIRGEESDLDTQFVIEFCREYDIDLECFSFDIMGEAKELKLSVEETARIFRYRAFEEVREKLGADKIAVAHNKNDNVETLIMRFFRGTGLRGLGGIPVKRDYIIRPLLNCERNLIEEYCRDNNILFRNDSTNFLEVYTRNKVRLSTIPYVQENFNPNIINTMGAMSQNFREEDVYLDSLAKEYLKEIIVNKEELDEDISYLDCLDYEEKRNNNNNNIRIIKVEAFKELNIVIQKRIIRIIIDKVMKNSLYNISSEHITSIITLNNNKTLNLPKSLTVYLKNNLLYIYIKKDKNNKKNSIEVSYNYELPLDNIVYIKEIDKYFLLTTKSFEDIKDIEDIQGIQDNIFNEYKKISKNLIKKVCTISLNCDKINNGIFLRQKVDGDKILLNNMNKKIKDLFINNKIPAYDRHRYPVLLDGLDNTSIIAVSGLFVSDLYKPYKNIIYLCMWEET